MNKEGLIMKIGVVYPQTEFGSDPAAIREYTQAAEELGYQHVLAYDHVLGANPDRPGWGGGYTYKDAFMEPFLLFGFMAGFSKSLEFAPNVIILPQRQTALVAKQAATLDILCAGRLRLGIGLGWNEIEYISLGENFHNRGRRIEEQIAVLRQLWSQPLVTFQGKWHAIPDAGLNPMPVQRPIPLWFGGHHANVLRRVGLLGDGWMPNYRTAAEAKDSIDTIRRAAAEAGRQPDQIGLNPRLVYGSGNPEEWAQAMQAWEAVGATHLSLNTMGSGFKTPSEHIQAVRRFAEMIKL